MSRVEVHPIDVNTLSKGEWLPPERCEEIIGVMRHDRRYSLRLLGLRDAIAEQWQEVRGEIITIVLERDGMRICTDEEAVEVNKERRLGHIRGLERTHVRQVGVDASKLSPATKALHEREMVVGDAFLRGGKQAKRAALDAHQRSIPKMLGDE